MRAPRSVRWGLARDPSIRADHTGTGVLDRPSTRGTNRKELLRHIKRAYGAFAQAVPGIWPGDSIYGERQLDEFGRWLASLGAIYHLQRMIALDIPWWNVDATAVIADFLTCRPDARVFEYGSGASTVWLARRAREVLTVEHDALWASDVAVALSGRDRVRQILAGSESDDVGPSYARSIEGHGLFDLIVIDGRHRADCLAAAVPHLAPAGLILFDDSGRARYRPAIANCGLIEMHYFGLSYCVVYPDHTSILAAPPVLAI
ncbi:class I SAM-dependent methyltransferase [Acuticoccus mangrovi]|uniref:Class I SAM-dependent methyltransferase n=1 Tax=Acuticoccus mangrovi TaxID=2796142 RepID=A0A934IRK0_9HYPH|nr:class I SAM-dependent methyltransferase [Acuticoccus mangrovi]MBJ3777350.1 class I SAM-dependent methyltransferase [Acuticoccus mangrovi]